MMECDVAVSEPDASREAWLSMEKEALSELGFSNLVDDEEALFEDLREESEREIQKDRESLRMSDTYAYFDLPSDNSPSHGKDNARTPESALGW